MKFDLVSDLHIDFWDDKFKHDWLKYQTSDTLVIAGDTSDSVDITCEYVTSLESYYKNIVIVDGNHEHQNCMTEIAENTKYWSYCIGQTRAHYLGDVYYQTGNTRFIGINGWWSFDFGAPNVDFERCMQAFLTKTNWGERAALLQLEQGVNHAKFLKKQMRDAQSDKTVEHVVVVTHPLPHPSCISWNIYPGDNLMVGLYGNTKFQQTLDADVQQKMRYWLFGHNHDQKNIPYGDARLVSNPRGRPKDWNRENYKPLQLEVPHA